MTATAAVLELIDWAEFAGEAPPPAPAAAGPDGSKQLALEGEEEPLPQVRLQAEAEAEEALMADSEDGKASSDSESESGSKPARSSPPQTPHTPILQRKLEMQSAKGTGTGGDSGDGGDSDGFGLDEAVGTALEEAVMGSHTSQSGPSGNPNNDMLPDVGPEAQTPAALHPSNPSDAPQAPPSSGLGPRLPLLLVECWACSSSWQLFPGATRCSQAKASAHSLYPLSAVHQSVVWRRCLR